MAVIINQTENQERGILRISYQYKWFNLIINYLQLIISSGQSRGIHTADNQISAVACLLPKNHFCYHHCCYCVAINGGKEQCVKSEIRSPQIGKYFTCQMLLNMKNQISQLLFLISFKLLHCLYFLSSQILILNK